MFFDRAGAWCRFDKKQQKEHTLLKIFDKIYNLTGGEDAYIYGKLQNLRLTIVG